MSTDNEHACDALKERLAHQVFQLLTKLGMDVDMRFAIILEFPCEHSTSVFVVSNTNQEKARRMFEDAVWRASSQGRRVDVALEGERNIRDSATGASVTGVLDEVDVELEELVHFGQQPPGGRA